MIITKRPLRVSFLGGGTDLPEMVEATGRGAVFTVPIEKYVYAVGLPGPCDVEKVDLDPSIDNPLTRAVISSFCKGTNKSTQSPLRAVRMLSDVPVIGTGLGGSASWVHALRECLGQAYSFGIKGYEPGELSLEDAVALERSTGSKCGYQDHAVAIHRRPGLYEFNSKSESRQHFVDPDKISSFLTRHVSLFYVGGRRDGNAILERITGSGATMSYSMSNLLTILDRGFSAFMVGDAEGFGTAVRESWRLKRSTDAGISNERIDAIIDYALEKGAYGAKLLGAGGAGYVATVSPGSSSLAWDLPRNFPGVQYVTLVLHREKPLP